MGTNKREVARTRSRTKILQAATALLRDSISVDDVTVRSVCARSGVSASTFYRSFTGRGQLLYELNQHLLDSVGPPGMELLEEVGGAHESIADLLPSAITHALDFAERELWFVNKFAPLIRTDSRHAHLLESARAGVLQASFEMLSQRVGDHSPVPRQRIEVSVWLIGTAMIRATAGRAPLIGQRAGSDSGRLAEVLSNTLIKYLESDVWEIPASKISPGLQTNTQRDGSVRSRILDAAETLLEQRDVAELTTLDIAIEADVAPATLHDTFGSRKALIRAVLDRVLSEVKDSAESELNSTGVEPLERPLDLVVYLTKVFELLSVHTSSRLHVLGAYELPQRTSDDVAELLLEVQDEVLNHVVAHAPPWVVEQGNLDAAIPVAVLSKELLQLAFWGPTAYGEALGWTQKGLAQELAIVVTSAIESNSVDP